MTIIRTKTAMTILLSLFALQTIGCASITSSYDRYERAPGQLNWSFDDALQLEKNGKLVAEAGDWSGLDKAVACVPRARKYAERASTQSSIGTFLTYGGAAAAIVSTGYVF